MNEPVPLLSIDQRRVVRRIDALLERGVPLRRTQTIKFLEHARASVLAGEDGMPRLDRVLLDIRGELDCPTPGGDPD